MRKATVQVWVEGVLTEVPGNVIPLDGYDLRRLFVPNYVPDGLENQLRGEPVCAVVPGRSWGEWMHSMTRPKLAILCGSMLDFLARTEP